MERERLSICERKSGDVAYGCEKETYIYEKRPIYMKRDLYMYGERHTYVKRTP